MSKQKGQAPAVRRLFWDVETSPNICLSWRIGGKIFLSPDSILQERGIICICYKWEGERKVHSLEWNKGDDRKMLEKFDKVIADADESVAHNGDRFDMPMFQGRRLIHGLPPQPTHNTVDTLKIARRHFKLNSNRLDYLGHTLGLGGKQRTEFQMWKDILLDNCPKAMAKMVRYCKRDVTLLEKVWEKITCYQKPKIHAGVNAWLEKWSCPHCATQQVKRSKRIVTAAGSVRHQMVCNECGRYYSVCNSAYEDYLTWRYDQKKEG